LSSSQQNKESKRNETLKRSPITMTTSSVLFYLGTILILHSAYSLLHYRELLQEIQDSTLGSSLSSSPAGSAGAGSSSAPGSSIGGGGGSVSDPPDLPVDVVVEVVGGFLLLLVSELIRPASALRPIANNSSSAQQGGRVVAPPYVSRDFDIYSTRAKAL
jgi:Membrane magnesium transporter